MRATTFAPALLFCLCQSSIIVSPPNLATNVATARTNKFIGCSQEATPANLTAPLRFLSVDLESLCTQFFPNNVNGKVVLLENPGATASIVLEEKAVICLENAGALAVIRAIHDPYSPGMQYYWNDGRLSKSTTIPALQATIDDLSGVIAALRDNIEVEMWVKIDTNQWAVTYRGMPFLLLFRICLPLLNMYGVIIALDAFFSHIHRRYYPPHLPQLPPCPQASFGRPNTPIAPSPSPSPDVSRTQSACDMRPRPQPSLGIPSVSSQPSFGRTAPLVTQPSFEINCGKARRPSGNEALRKGKEQPRFVDKTSGLMIVGSFVELLGCITRVVYFAGGGLLSNPTFPFTMHIVVMTGTISIELITTLVGVVLFLRWSKTRESTLKTRFEKGLLVFGVCNAVVGFLVSILQGLYVGEISLMVQLSSGVTFLGLFGANVLFLWSGHKFVKRLNVGIQLQVDKSSRRRSKTKAVSWLMASALAGLVQCVGMAATAVGSIHFRSPEGFLGVLGLVAFGITGAGVAHALAFRPLQESGVPITTKVFQVTGLQAFASGSLRVFEGIRSLSFSSKSTTQQPALIWTQSNGVLEIEGV